MRRALIIIAAVAVAALGGVWAASAFAPCALPPALLAKFAPSKAAACPAQAADEPAVPPPPAVSVAPAERREFVERLFVSGTLVARDEAMVGAPLDGLRLTEILADDGDTVKKGQVLARLDRSQLDALLAENDAAVLRAKATIEQAKSQIGQFEASLAQASADLERSQKLGPQIVAGSTLDARIAGQRVAKAQLDAARNALSVAEADEAARSAERQELQVRLDRTEIKAPVAGLVTRRSARLGAVVSGSGEALFRIIVDGAIDLEADAPQQSLARFAVGMPATLRLPGVADPVEGRVRLISAEVDKASRTGKVRIALSDVSHARIGSFASGEVELVRRDGVGAPASALRRDGDVARLYVVRDGRVEERQVTPGIVEGETVEIKDGVAAGESVVARAAAFLRPGDRVRATPEATPAGG
jgi:RND family efflux transporter MFP subunit